MENPVIAIVGLGYVGLPLVVEFGKIYQTIGFDISRDKVAKCSSGTDPAGEVSDVDMAKAVHAIYTTDPEVLEEEWLFDIGSRVMRAMGLERAIKR